MSTRIRITAITAISDGRGNRYRAGQVVDVADDLATAWVKAGHAVKAGKASSNPPGEQDERPDPPEAVTATNEPPATTTARSRKSRKTGSD